MDEKRINPASSEVQLGLDESEISLRNEPSPAVCSLRASYEEAQTDSSSIPALKDRSGINSTFSVASRIDWALTSFRMSVFEACSHSATLAKRETLNLFFPMSFTMISDPDFS